MLCVFIRAWYYFSPSNSQSQVKHLKSKFLIPVQSWWLITWSFISVFSVVTKLQSKQVYLNRFWSIVTVTDCFDKLVDEMFSCSKASEIELFLVECLSGVNPGVMGLEELKLSACSLCLCFLRFIKFRAEKSHDLQGKEDPLLYFTVDRFTCLGPRVWRTSLLYSSTFSIFFFELFPY